MRLSGTIFSKVLDMDTGITILTPNNLSESGNHKVVYLLHGICGNNKTWIDYSMLSLYARNSNTIFIMPEVARSFYADMKFGLKYFTYITEELPKICKDTFNISTKREDTAIVGGSMGGYGALKCALSKPEQYGMCAAFSSCCLFIREEQENMKKFGMKEKFIERFGPNLSADLFAAFGPNLDINEEDDVLGLVKKVSKSDVKPKIYIASGSDDIFFADNKKYSEEVEKLGYDFTFDTWKATHDFPFFDEALRRTIEKFAL